MKWIKINSIKDLPPEGKYVIAKHNCGNWNDSDDQENVNTVVVKLVKGISIQERKLMADGILPDKYENDTIKPGLPFTPNDTLTTRSEIYRFGDEFANNLVPYQWKTFGPTSFFGQEITHYCFIEPLIENKQVDFIKDNETKKQISKNEDFKLYDEANGACCFCGRIGCRQSCFK